MKLLLALGTAALLTTACTASASVPGSGAAKSAKTVQVASGANAGSNVQGESDVNRVNPLIGKAGSHQVPPAKAAPLAPAAAPTPGGIKDRCNGIGNPSGAGNRAVPAAGKGPQLPACMPQ
ncbi:MAG TPA: hypothetical protein VGD57_11425 [Candidatus Dormibacteraeota bacterium]